MEPKAIMSNLRVSAADQLLVEQVVRGDEHGWRQLVGKFQHRLTAFTRSKLGPAERTLIAEDLVQETFCLLYTSPSPRDS